MIASGGRSDMAVLGSGNQARSRCPARVIRGAGLLLAHPARYPAQVNKPWT